MNQFLTFFFPIYFLLFFGIAFLWRTWRTWKQTGINAYVLMQNPGVEEVTYKYFRLLPFASVLVVLVFLSGPDNYEYLSPIRWLEHFALQAMGITVVTVALGIIIIAQVQMGESWRIGVDYEHSTPFVQRGLFRYSRNPIFFGIILSATGYFLLLPNALTLLIMMLDIVVIEVQVRMEEQHLESEHPQEYQRYCREVRRWI